MCCVLFDDEGRKPGLPSQSAPFAVDGKSKNFQFGAFMVTNSGWVKVTRDGAFLSVTLRPAKVSPMALAGALAYIHSAPVTAGRLVLYDATRPSNYEFASRAALVAALCRAMNEAGDARENRFARRAIKNGARRLRPEISHVIDAWNELRGALDMERLWRLLTVGLAGRYILVANRPDGLRLDSMGHGFVELANYWTEGQAPPKVSDQPDLAYGRWVEDAYTDVVRSKAPLVEMVDCDIAWPNEGTRRHRYWRVIAPFYRSADNCEILMSVSLRDRSVHLRHGGAVDAA